MADGKYQGWKNYPTWAYKLWMDNDQGSQEYWREVTTELYDGAKKDKYLSKKDNAIHALADKLRDDLEEFNPLKDTATVYTDLMQYAIDSIDYREIAIALIDELLEERKYQAEHPA